MSILLKADVEQLIESELVMIGLYTLRLVCLSFSLAVTPSVGSG